MSSRWPYPKRGGYRFFRGRKKNKSIALAFVPKLNRNIGEEEDEYKGDSAIVNSNDVIDETLLCISYGNGLLGAAVYEQSSELIRVMNDISEDGDFEFVKKLIDEIKPTTILANNSQDLSLISFLQSKCGGKPNAVQTNQNSSESRSSDDIPRWDPTVTTDQTDETTEQLSEDDDSDDDFGSSTATKLVKLSNNFFKYTKALTRFNELFNADDVTSTAEERQMIVKMRIDMEAVHMVKSFGALLFYLDDIRLGVENQPLNVRTTIKAIKTYTLDSLVEIDHNTFRALDIFPKDDKKSVNGKKSSLLSMMNKCKSTVGRRCLTKWFKNPTTNREVLRSRQRCIHYFIQDCNLDLTNKIVRKLNHVKGLQHIFKKFQAGTSTFVDWDGFTDTVAALSEIVEIVQQTAIKKELIDDEISLKDFAELLVIIRSIIDFEDSKNEGRVSVCSGVDKYLDEYKETYKSLPSVLTAIAESEGVRLGIEDKCSCIYVPLIGYLIALPHDFPISEHPGMTLVYRTETEIRVRNEMTQRLEEEIGDIRLQIIDKETAIILRLKKMIMRKRRKINKFISLAAKVDVIISMARIAAEMGWNCPSLVDEPILEATSLYHPLSALITTKEFVPNRVMSGVDGTKISIITGPNACGKSIYMKQVGILAFLAHIGSFVPARHAKIGPIDRIVTRMFTVDSVLDGMSTFARDVEQVAVALRKSTVKSLVIIDEFGKGTMTEVGLSLLASCLTHWIEKGFDKCPHIFASSHFHALPKYIPVENEMVAFLTFRVEKMSGGRFNYLFKLIEGIVDCSFAMTVAKDEKVPLKVIGRACQIYAELKSGKPLKEVKSNVINDSGDADILKFVDEIIDGSELLGNIEKIVATSQNRQSRSETLSKSHSMEKQRQREMSRTSAIERCEKSNSEEDMSDEYEEEEEMEIDEPTCSTGNHRKNDKILEKEASQWIESLERQIEPKNKAERGILKKRPSVSQAGNLSVSFVAPRVAPTRQKGANLSSQSSSQCTPKSTSRRSLDVNSLIQKLLPVNKMQRSNEVTKVTKQPVARPVTPPSPVLFSSEDEEEDVRVEHFKQKSSETSSIKKLEPLMRRLSSNEKKKEIRIDTLSSPSSRSNCSAIYSTPKFEEAKKRMRIEQHFMNTSNRNCESANKTPTFTPVNNKSIAPSGSRASQASTLQRHDEKSSRFRTPSFENVSRSSKNVTPLIYSQRHDGDSSQFRTPSRNFENPIRSSKNDALLMSSQQRFESPHFRTPNIESAVRRSESITPLMSSQQRSSHSTPRRIEFSQCRTPQLESIDFSAARKERTPVLESQKSSVKNTPIRRNDAGDFVNSSQQWHQEPTSSGDHNPERIDFSQVSPLFSSQVYKDFNVRTSSKRSISPSSVILSQLVEKRQQNEDDYMRTPSPSPLFDSQNSNFGFKTPPLPNFDTLFDRQNEHENEKRNKEDEEEFMRNFGMGSPKGSGTNNNHINDKYDHSSIFESEKSLVIDTQVFDDSVPKKSSTFMSQ